MTSASTKPFTIEDIDQCLPQTQCTQCDYPRCRDYAVAIYHNEADINQCPPGGDVTIHALAQTLGVASKPLNTEHGVTETRKVAIIEESDCIGCKLCIKACPVDCIVGAGKMMHTVISADCTGCKLCLPVCPTDCIDLINPANTVKNEPDHDVPSMWPDFSQMQVNRARLATEQKLLRVAEREQKRKQRHQISEKDRMKQEIMRAVKRHAEKKRVEN